MRIIFATHNEDKLREIREILREFPGEIISKKEIGEWEDAVEDGSSFLENAEIKAYDLYVRLKKKELLQDGDIIMADDSGLSIEALSFGPGIYSARFLGENPPHLLFPSRFPPHSELPFLKICRRKEPQQWHR